MLNYNKVKYMMKVSLYQYIFITNNSRMFPQYTHDTSNCGMNVGRVSVHNMTAYLE